MIKEQVNAVVNNIQQSSALKDIIANVKKYTNDQEVSIELNNFINSFKLYLLTSENQERLLKSTTKSLLECCINVAQLDLTFNTALEYAYILPFWNKDNKNYDASLCISYKGFIHLARRNPQLKAIRPFIIYNHELNDRQYFYEDYGSGEILYKPNYLQERIPNNIAAATCVIDYINGGKEWDTMLIKDIIKQSNIELKDGTFFKTDKSNNSFWQKHWQIMIYKAPLKRALMKTGFPNILQASSFDKDTLEEEDIPSKNVTPEEKTISQEAQALIKDYLHKSRDNVFSERFNKLSSEEDKDAIRKELFGIDK